MRAEFTFLQAHVGLNLTTFLESVTLRDNSAFKFAAYGIKVKVVYDDS